ncbi:hypothetical protein [Actinomadura sp. 9N215]|uniref:hypothetical protein n=1 Tax=Actinomadura sp. 9N215 TaxID=3375150 RepID=UPI0037928114
MSSTVEVYLAYSGGMPALAQRIGVLLGVSGYFGTAQGYTYTINSTPGLGESGFATLRLSDTDWIEDDSGTSTAFEAYGYQLSTEVRNVHHLSRGEVQERLGRDFFDRLTGLGRPLALGDGMDIFADFLPGRGVRDFPPGTSWDEDGKELWFEPALHDADAKAAPAQEAQERTVPARGSVVVFEQNGLLQFVPHAAGGGDGLEAVAPVASARRDAGPDLLGRTLAEVLDRSAQADVVVDANPWEWVTGTSRMDADEYARAAVSVGFDLEGESFAAVPRGTYTGPAAGVAQGPVLEPLMVRESRPWDDRAMGELVLRLIDRLREHAHS